MTPEICPGCDGAEFRSLKVRAREVTIKVCVGCGLHINTGGVGAARAAREGTYEGAYHGRQERYARRKLRSATFRMRLIEGLMAPGKLLDIGCSVGHFVQAAGRSGWDAWGVDISQYAVGVCRQRGLQAKIGDMRRLDFPDDTFDVVNLRHVLEHDWELRACLAEIRRVLKTGGLLVLEVPCVDCWQVRILRGKRSKFWRPVHCYFFSGKSVRSIMARAGYDEVRMPLYGRAALSGGVGESLRFLAWRTAKLLKGLVGVSSAHVSVWRKPAPVCDRQ
ncbi:MAG: class I SAM-dependent methyltransferase [Armatimonadota bacterium]|jgi:SAM-dependent methyltransferase